MKAIRCELCGNNNLTKIDGMFVCDYCGTKYTLEEARKLFIEGTVSISGDVKTKAADFEIQAGTLIKYRGESPIVNIPETVKIIADKCFFDEKSDYYGLSIEKVIIPEGVEEIGHAFYYCTKLVSVSLPDSLKNMIGTFECCSSLTSITIPRNIVTMMFAFERCSSLSSVTLSDGLKCISRGTFLNCNKLKSIVLPSSITQIEESAFAECISLQSITIPKSVTRIGVAAFKDCQSLTSITIPSSVTVIERHAFSGAGLTSITIPDSVVNIGEGAFSCPNLDPLQTHTPIFDIPVFGNHFLDAGFCPYCAGKLKQGLFSSTCTRCKQKFS